MFIPRFHRSVEDFAFYPNEMFGSAIDIEISCVSSVEEVDEYYGTAGEGKDNYQAKDELAIASCCRLIFWGKTQHGALRLRFRYFADANIR